MFKKHCKNGYFSTLLRSGATKKKKYRKKKTRWVTLLQWTRYTKTIADHEETKGTTKKTLHVCFGAVGLQPFLVFCVFLVFLQKHCFPTDNGLFCSFLNVPLSFSLVLSLFLFHSLSVLITNILTRTFRRSWRPCSSMNSAQRMNWVAWSSSWPSLLPQSSKQLSWACWMIDNYPWRPNARGTRPSRTRWHLAAKNSAQKWRMSFTSSCCQQHCRQSCLEERDEALHRS